MDCDGLHFQERRKVIELMAKLMRVVHHVHDTPKTNFCSFTRLKLSFF